MGRVHHPRLAFLHAKEAAHDADHSENAQQTALHLRALGEGNLNETAVRWLVPSAVKDVVNELFVLYFDRDRLEVLSDQRGWCGGGAPSGQLVGEFTSDCGIFGVVGRRGEVSNGGLAQGDGAMERIAAGRAGCEQALDRVAEGLLVLGVGSERPVGPRCWSTGRS
ncbi:hypothetical protein GCM10010304_79910 [Streptomyces roseoviolaceus]